MLKLGEAENQVSGAIIDAAIEVHKELGPGFLESVYESALCVELKRRDVPYERQVPVPLRYKGEPIGEHRLDLLVKGLVVAELKAVDQTLPIHRAQVISYLKATGLSLGLLINFRVPVLKDGVERLILTR